MSQPFKILSFFLEIAVLQINEDGTIIKVLFNTKEDFDISQFENVYDIFAVKEKYRLKRLLESGFHVKKKYMQLSKSTGIKETVDIEVHEYKSNTYLYIQFFASKQTKEAHYDRHVEKLAIFSGRDSMTKVLNRQGFYENFRKLVKGSDAKKRIGFIYIDIDNLKYINDTYGHKYGDKAIMGITKALVSTVRNRDIVARLGGDEFLVVVEEVSGSKSTAYGLAERLLKNVSKNKTDDTSTTISVGVHVFEVSEFTNALEDLTQFRSICVKQIDTVDKATYVAKKSGRNQIAVSAGYGKFY